PAAERDRVIALAQERSELPSVLDAPRDADALIAAEHDERLKPVLVRAVGIRQAVLERMFRRQDRHDVLARCVAAEIDDEVPQIVFFALADGAVGEKYERALPRQPPDRVVRVDPRVHALAGLELGA